MAVVVFDGLQNSERINEFCLTRATYANNIAVVTLPTTDTHGITELTGNKTSDERSEQ